MSLKEDASAVGTITIWGLAIIVVLAVLGFAANYFGLVSDRFFMPRQEQVRHQTFECSDSHVDGLVRELRQIRDQWKGADAAGKAALADTFKHEYNGFTCGQLPEDLQAFYNAL
jgi:hypothetical protein